MSITNKSIGKIKKSKKNSLVWMLLIVMVSAFVLAIYNQIDMDSAIAAHNQKNRKVTPPENDKNIKDSGNTKVTWAINMENTLGRLEDEQKDTVKQMAENTKIQITAGNAIILEELNRNTMLLTGKLKELTNEQTRLKKELKASKLKNDSNINALKNQLDDNEMFIGNFENNVMLPPPLMNNKISTSGSNENGSLFEKINIIKQKIKDIIPEATKKIIRKSPDYKIVSYANDYIEENNNSIAILSDAEKLKQNTYEIVTSFTSAYMITGAYAPLFGASGGESKNVPVLIETNGDLLMPNDTIGSIDKCFLLGIAEGNAGSRTVDIRLDKMTCLVGSSKKILQGSIEGYVVSEAGTPGLPANLIYKAGDFIGRMIGSGILEGLSTAVVNYASNVGNSGTNSQYFGDVAGGASNGMSNAFSKLADFYLKLAEATIPMLEVKSGRHISIVLVGSNKFELKDVNLLDVRDVDSYVNELIGDEL